VDNYSAHIAEPGMDGYASRANGGLSGNSYVIRDFIFHKRGYCDAVIRIKPPKADDAAVNCIGYFVLWLSSF